MSLLARIGRSVLSPNKKRNKIIMVVMFCFQSGLSFADSGCWIGANNNIYPDKKVPQQEVSCCPGSGVYIYTQTNPVKLTYNNNDQTTCQVRQSDVTFYYNLPQCSVEGISNWGTQVSYNNSAKKYCTSSVALPLDDYIPLFLIVLAITGIYYIHPVCRVPQNSTD